MESERRRRNWGGSCRGDSSVAVVGGMGRGVVAAAAAVAALSCRRTYGVRVCMVERVCVIVRSVMIARVFIQSTPPPPSYIRTLLNSC